MAVVQKVPILELVGGFSLDVYHARPSAHTLQVCERHYCTWSMLLVLWHHNQLLSSQDFGMTKGVYKPASDFKFDFVAEVICYTLRVLGFWLTLTLERDLQSTSLTER